MDWGDDSVAVDSDATPPDGGLAAPLSTAPRASSSSSGLSSDADAAGEDDGPEPGVVYSLMAFPAEDNFVRARRAWGAFAQLPPARGKAGLCALGLRRPLSPSGEP